MELPKNNYKNKTNLKMKNINLKTPGVQAISKLIKEKIDMCESFIKNREENDTCFLVEEDGLLKFRIKEFGIVNPYASIGIDKNIELDEVSLIKEMISEINNEYESFVGVIGIFKETIDISLQKTLNK